MFLLLLSILPVFVICCFVYLKDKNKESLKLLLKLLVFGSISSIPIIFFELLIGSFFPTEESLNLITLFFYVFISIAFVEELWKLLMVYWGSFNHREFNNLYDMIIYSTFVSMGFALVENILYVVQGGFNVGIMRSFLSVPAHGCFGVMMGYYLGLSKISLINNNFNLHKRNLLLSIFVPTILHTLYDYFLLSNMFFLVIIFFIFIFIIFIICIRKVLYVSKNARDFGIKSKYCIKCGNPVNNKFCPKCGNENK